LTYQKATNNARTDRYKEISKKLLSIDKGFFPYTKPNPGRTPLIMDEDFLEKMNWVNFRTQASMDMPCISCGCLDNIEMHNVKHVRKSKFSLTQDEKPWEKMMHIRNRKQVPVCKQCHDKIHSGEYNKTKLINIPNQVTLIDNRIVNIENYITKRVKPYEGMPLYESLLSKGWKTKK
jgi:hypothetical protein